MNEALLYSAVPLIRASKKRTKSGEPAAIGAFNVNFRAQADGILLGLYRAGAPGILQASKGANKFQGGADKIQYMVLESIRRFNTGVVICLNLDHGDEKSCYDCIENGFGAVMIDHSTKKIEKDGRTIEEKTPIDENIEITRRVVERAHAKGVSVEGEIGVLAGKEEDKEAKRSIYPTPNEVLFYGKKSGVDIIAAACGTCHGPIKNFKGLEYELLRESVRKFEQEGLEVALCLHGSSTVSDELVKGLNDYGWTLKNAGGVPMEAIRDALRYVDKINIDTDLRIIITIVFRKYFLENKGVEEESELLGGIKSILIDGFNPVTGETIGEPGRIIDPRTYLANVPREILREDYIKTELEEVMHLTKMRIANHVEYLANKFGSEGLSDLVDRSMTMERMKEVYAGG